MGAGGGNTVSQEVDPQFSNRLYTLYGDAQRYANQTPYQQYGGQGVAGFQPMQHAAQSYLSQQLLGQNLGFASPDRYSTNPYGQFQFSDPQNLSSGEGVTKYIDPQGMMGPNGAGPVVTNTTNTVDPNNPNFPWGGQQSLTSQGGPQIQNAQFAGQQAPQGALAGANLMTSYGQEYATPQESTGEMQMGGVQQATPDMVAPGKGAQPFNPWDIARQGMQGIGDAYQAAADGNVTRRSAGYDGNAGGRNVFNPGYGPGEPNYDPASNPNNPQSPFYPGVGTTASGGGPTPEAPRPDVGNYAGPWAAANQGAQGTAQNLMNYQAQTGAQGMGNYQNAWENQVVNNAQNDLARSADIAAEQNIFSKGSGTYGGDRMGVQAGEAQRNYLDRAGALSANLRSQGFNVAAANAQQDATRGLGGANLGLGAANSLNNFGTSALNNTVGQAQALSQMGNKQQGMAQAYNDYDRNQFYEARDYPMQQFGLQQSILSGMPVGMNQTMSGGSPWGSAAGGAMAGFGMGGPWGAAIGGGLGLLGGF